MRSLRPLHASLLLAGAAPFAVPAVHAQEIVQPLPGTTDADKLADAIRRVGANPRDLSALVEAGELSIRVGDTTAAAALFKRAEAIDARNARVKAGIARIMVNGEHPGEALRYFDLAQRYGLQPAVFADDRGLAYDLIGQQERAQRDYRLALRTTDSDEVRRRYALSLGISGHKDEALDEIDALLRKSDRGAWRARAFILAMNGDAAGANKIATGMMPPGMAAGLSAFFTRLPTLNAADRAFAVHFGEVTPTPSRLADARLVPPLPVLGPDPYAPRRQVVEIAAAPRKESAGERRRREREEKRAQQLAAREAAQARKAAAKAARNQSAARPVAVAASGTVPRSASVAATMARPAPPPATAAAQPSFARAPMPAATTPAVSLASARPGQSPPARQAAAPTAVPPIPATVAATRPALSSPISPTPTPPASSTAREVGGVQTAEAARPAPATPAATGAPTPARATASPAPARQGSSPVREASGVQTAQAARLSPATTVTASQRAPAPARATPASAPTPRPAPTQLASTTLATSPRPAPVPMREASVPAQPPPMVDDSILSRIVANISIPASELGVAPPPSRAPVPEAGTTQTLDEAAQLAERNAAAEEARKQRLADRKAQADAKAAAAKKAADAKAFAEKKAAAAKAAEEKKAERANAARIWVQVAGGANDDDLARAWKDAQRKSTSLAGRKGYSTPLRATNRVVTGPFKTDAEAQAFVNRLGREGVSAFTFTSAAGQKVSPLGGQK